GWKLWRQSRVLRSAIEVAIRAARPDIIHAHSPVLIGLPAQRAARKHRIPFVYEIRDLWENASVDRGKFKADSLRYQSARALETYFLRRADAVVTICEQLARELASRLPDSRSLHIVGNGVDAAQVHPRNDRLLQLERGDWEGKKIIAYVGTFQPYEGLELLIQSMKQVALRD